MKKHLLFNQSFGTEGSPNQTGKTLTPSDERAMTERKPRGEKEQLSSTCLRSASVLPPFRYRYLRYAAMIFAVLVMSVANIGMAWGKDVHYVLVSKGYAPLTKKSLDASYNVLKTDGSTIGKVTSISSSITSEASLYYNSTSPTYANLTSTSNYGTSSGDNNTLKGINISSGSTMTISLGSQTFTKVDVIYRCNSSSAGTLTVAGDAVATTNQNIGLKSKTGTFSSSITISAASQAYRVVVILTRAYSPSYTVTYDANGGSGVAPSDANTYESDDPVTVLGKNTLSKSGYIFTGWNTKANGSGTPYSPGETMNTGAGNVTLHAQWDTEVDLKYVWKTGNKFCDDNSTSTTTVNMISENDYFTLTGTGVSQESGSSLNIGKKVNNYFLITAKSGYQIKSICFNGKIESDNVNKTTDNSDWSGTITSAGTEADKRYTFDDINSTYFGVKLNTADKGIYIRNMVITIAAAPASPGYKLSVFNSSTNGEYNFVAGTGENEIVINDFVIPEYTAGGDSKQFWVGPGSYTGHAANEYFSWKRAYHQQNNSCTSNLTLGSPVNAIGTLHAWTNSDQSNYGLCFEPNGYGIVWGVDGSPWTNVPFESTGEPTVWLTDIVSLTSDMISNYKYYVGLLTNDGGYVGSFREEGDARGLSNTDNISGMRRKTASGDNWANGLVAGHGKFRIWVDNCTQNFYCHFVPHYKLTYNANGGSGAPEAAYVSVEETPCQWSLSNTQPTWADHVFLGWSTNSSATAADDNAEVADLGNPYTASGNVTLYAVWQACSGPNGGSATYTAAGYTYDLNATANTMSLTGVTASNGGALSYQWYKTTSDVAHGEAISGATSNTYRPATDVAHAANWYYFCRVTEAGCSTTYTSGLSGAIVVNEAATLYTVTYNVNGGGSVTPTSATQASSGAAVILPTPTWSGYTFEGWYNAGTKIGNGGASYTPTADITLYAHWTDNISGKVFSFIDNNYGDKFKAFDLSGWVTGDANNKDKTHTNATTGVSYVIDDATWENKSMAVAALAKFKGGTTKMSVVIPTGKIATVKISYGAYGTGASDYSLTVNGTSQTNPSTKLTNEMTNAQVISSMKEITLSSQTGTLTLGISNTSKSLYIGRVSAVITGYTVSYDKGSADGASGSLASGTKTHGSNFTLSSSDNAFTRDGYTYDGWSKNADGSTKDYTLGGTYSTDAAITLYPHWVTEASVSATLLTDTYVRTGSTDVQLSVSITGASAGWYYRVKNTGNDGYQTPDEVAYNTATWTMTSTVGAGANPFVVELYNGSKEKMAESSTITVYGETGQPMTIAAGEGGSASPASTWANGDHLHPEITATPASGYHFVNWTKDNENATLANANAATTTITNASGACTITANFAADATLYTVTFNSNGGSSVSPIEQASAGASITMPAAPTYSGYTFQGWVIGGTTYDPEDPYTPEANVTAYAIWKANCAGGGGGGSTTTTLSWFDTSQGSRSSSNYPSSLAKWLYGYSNSAKSSAYAYTITTANTNNKGQGTGDSDYLRFDNGSSIYIYADNTTTSGTPASFNDVTAVSLKIKLTKDAGTSATIDIKVGSTTIADDVDLSEASTSSFKLYEFEADNLDGTIQIIHNKSGDSKYNLYIDDIAITTAGGGGATCHYVTYDGNGADGGSVSDKTAYTSGTNVTVLGNVDSPAAFTKTDYRFNGWNTAANGSGTSYAAGDKINNIRANVTLYAQWVLDACSAPAAPTISGTASRTVGQNIELTATCATGADGSTTYTWYKGVDWATASAASPVQAAMTAGAGGRTFTKASCAAGDAGKYWCKASNGTGCEAHNATGFTVTVSAAVEEHIYYYKDANHYSDGTYSDPEGNTAVKKDNQSLSSPWMICNECKAGVDSVVAHGATYDGKGNHMNAYIKLPTGGDATTKNIKFALTAGYTGTLTMKIGGYESNPTVTLQPLVAGVLGDAISYSGTVRGVATTENNFGEITWNLSTAGGTYVLTVTSKTGYISQIDMTTATTARFNVSYDGNGSTSGSVPEDDNDYAVDASVTVQAQGTMEKANYTFGGWNTANNGTGTNYVAGSGTFSIKGATTLYAHWTQTINLAPGAKGTGSLGATVSWNGTAVRGFTAHTAAGYSLTGYYTETSGGTKVLNADGSFAATNIDGYITDGKWSRTGAAATLYAQWSGSAIVTNTLGVGSSSKWKSTISTTAPLQITDLSALAAVGGLTIEDANGTSADGRALTCKVEASGATTKTDDKYLQLSFSIAAGYKLRVTGLDVTVRSVSKAGKYHLELVGTTGSLTPDDEQVASGVVNTIFDDAYNVELTGDVTLKLWAYGADSDNKMSNYRLGSPIAIYGAVEETCTPPTFSGLDYSATEYTQPASASAISVTGAENVDSYQWKNSAVNDRTSGTNCGTGASVTPSTASTGTLYYWCELTNECTTVKTPTVAITVSASASNPSVTWSDVKLNGAATTVNYGGGKYELRATVNETTWSGTLESSMVTAPAGIYIHNIGTGTEAGKKYIEFQFDVTTAFDREANDKIGFHLSLPAISGTPNWNALTSDKLVTYEACDEGEGGMIYLPLTETQTTAASGMKYYWETAGSGRLASQYGGSAMGSTLAAAPYRTADYDFPRYAASTGDKWMFQTYVGGVNKIRVVFRAGGALKSSNLTISKFLYDTEYFSSQGDRQVSIGEVSPSKASFASGEDGYMEFTVPEMAANSYAYFQTGSSNIKIYGIVLYSESSGSGGSVETDPTWTGGLNKNGSSVVDKNQGDPNFTYTISTTTNTLGGITYSSSNSSVAEVNATTGEVRITATGESTQTAVITATLARSGCYKPATRTYTVRVAGQECTITSAGTLTADKTSKCESDNVVLSLSGHDTDGTTVTWYRGETNVTGSVSNNTLTTSTAGAYSVVVSKSGCSLRSNTVNITDISAATSATKIVDKWYIKNGRLTPDIALWRLDEGTTFAGVSWSPSNSTGLDFVIREGIVYLEGKEPNFNGSDDKEYTLTLTITDACGTPHSLTDKTITIIHQKNTDKHVLAFVVGNTEKNGDKYVAIGKGFTESIPASQTTNVGLYNEIAKNFDVQATNIYSTDDEQKIKEYYSQFDIICITDYPNTKTKGAHSVSYSDAIGVMVDIRPVLTMEAWVSGLANWNKKGISGDPKSPTTRQYTMLLQCKDHEIFAGTKLTEIGEGDDKMYRIHMVDETQHPYDTLDANYGSGTHESKKGYRYGSYPALQGFTFSQAMEDADLLPLGLIDDGAGKDLQVGLERQHEMSARMMVLGINSTAMERLTADGQTVVINALKYLMKKNAEEIADCSTSFVGGAEGDETNWMNADNWTGNTVPDKTQKVRILAPCVVPEGEKPHVAGVLIAPNDGGTYNGGSTPTNGSLTIAAGGALVVDGKIQAVTAPAYNRPRATTPADLAVLANADAQGALIFDNSEGETQATVQMYSKASGAPNNCTWQWIATPFSNVNRAIEFYYGAWMYEWDNATHAWTQILNDDPMEPFKGYSITQEAAGSYWMNGVLASTENIEQVLRSDEINGKNNGINVIGNSWTAPIQIENFEAEDFTNAYATIFILNTGLDEEGNHDAGTNNSTAGQYISIPVEASALMESTLKVIPAMQAFQVKAHVGGGSLNMDYDRLVRKAAMRQEHIGEPMRAPGRQIHRAPRVNKAEVERMHITIRGSRFQDEVYIFAHPDFTEGFDNGWDGEKIRGASEAVQLFVRDATSRWAVAAVPTFVGTYLATYKGEDNEYTISFDYSGDETLYWYDTKTDIYTEINAENTYTYTTDVSTIQTRFMITNENPKLEVPTGVESEKATNTKAVKFIDEDKMYIFVNGKLYDATGKVVK